MPDKYESHLDIDPATELLGPFGNPHRTKTGENLINIMREHQLRAAATFFDNNNKYNTWLAPPHPSTAKRQAYQLDHFLIPKYQLCQTTNVKRKFDGATSDHAALQIDFHLLNTPLLRKKETQKELLPPPNLLTIKFSVTKNYLTSKKESKISSTTCNQIQRPSNRPQSF